MSEGLNYEGTHEMHRGELISVLWHLMPWNIFRNILILQDLKIEIVY